MNKQDKISEIEIHRSYIEQCKDRIEKRKLQKKESLEDLYQVIAANIHDSIMISMSVSQIRTIQSQPSNHK